MDGVNPELKRPTMPERNNMHLVNTKRDDVRPDSKVPLSPARSQQIESEDNIELTQPEQRLNLSQDQENMPQIENTRRDILSSDQTQNEDKIPLSTADVECTLQDYDVHVVEEQVNNTSNEDQPLHSEVQVEETQDQCNEPAKVQLKQTPNVERVQLPVERLGDTQQCDRSLIVETEFGQNSGKVTTVTSQNLDEIVGTVEETDDQSYVVPDEKNSESDNSEDLSSNDDQIILSSNGSNSQFYESSDTKMDYAVKVDDNDTLSDIEDIKTDTASADSEDSALGSLPPDNTDNTDNAVVNDMLKTEQEAQEPSEGSDLGLGSEAPDESKPNFNNSTPISRLNKNSEGEITNFETPNERKTEDCIPNDEDKEQESTLETDDDDKPLAQLKRPLKSSLKRKCEEVIVDEPQAKKKKEGIRFDNVTVYYFPRAQGFSCVPSQGGSTLGMEWEHSHIENFSLAEHALEQRRLHRQILQQLKNEHNSLDGIAISSSEDSDSEEEASDISESELDLDSYYFLQPVPTRQRRALLRAAGVRKIEAYEKNECRDIRTSREFCGCACKVVCDPENCSCSLAGIKCQVDRLNFPCGCTRDGCRNTTGRIEFNPVRVRTHFIHTLMRLVDKNHEENQAVAKRHWSVHTQASCAQISAYARDRSHTQEDGLLRDVNLTPRVEVESCVNNGSFNNIHTMNNVTMQNSLQGNMNYHYSNDTANQETARNETNVMHYIESNNHHSHSGAYTSNMLQGKGPPYPTNTAVGYDTMTNIQRFPCDLNYTYDQHTDSNHFKGLHSYSATSFEEFAHSSQMSMFSHYGQMYVPDYLHKPSTSMHNHSSLQYQAMPSSQNHYEMYKTTSGCVNSESKTESQSNYTTLMTMPYHSSNKLHVAETDQNWFRQSQDTLIGAEGSEQTTLDASAAPPEQPAPLAEAAAENNASETTENFGELIKKTMVESVAV